MFIFVQSSDYNGSLVTGTTEEITQAITVRGNRSECAVLSQSVRCDLVANVMCQC